MIPLFYKLRNGIKIKNHGDSVLVISEIPLNVIKISERIAKMLKLCDGTKDLVQIAQKVGLPGNEYVFGVCEYFRKKGVLEVAFNEEKLRNLPFVSIIIPTKDRIIELKECVQSIISQNYPSNKLELIIIDDGSKDGTVEFLKKFPIQVLSNRISKGQSYCRNLGARKANGDILAFIDSDCIASENWLLELVPYFNWNKIGAVGGFVDGYYKESTLDLYEKVFSPLNMGDNLLYSSDDDSSFYVPTCNLLILKKVFFEIGGITESLHVGEDVDLCWRMRQKGYYLIYVPLGVVKHKHRNKLTKMIKRRFDYGTSEALLYTLHKEKKKILQLPPFAFFTFLSFCMAIIFLSPFLLLPGIGCFFIDGLQKANRLRALSVGIPIWKVFFSIIRSYFSFFYFASFHLVSYYISFLVLAGCIFYPLWFFCLFVFFFSFFVDYSLKKPMVSIPACMFYYAAEHISYQIGVFVGALRLGEFGHYIPKVIRRNIRYQYN